MRYSLDLTELLPLKAFYLGFSLKDHVDLSRVLVMVDESVERCGESENLPTRKVFYLLLKCELNRYTNNVIENRKIVKKYCEEKDHIDFFNNYMKIVNSTLLSTNVVGGGGMSIVKSSEISDHEKRPIVDQWGNLSIGKFDTPLEALGLHGYQCSEKEFRFLHEVTLKEMLDKHFGE